MQIKLVKCLARHLYVQDHMKLREQARDARYERQ